MLGEPAASHKRGAEEERYIFVRQQDRRRRVTASVCVSNGSFLVELGVPVYIAIDELKI